MRATFVLSTLAVAIPALGAPTVIPIYKHAGPVKPNSYIIKFRDEAAKGTVLDLVEKGPGSTLAYDYGEGLSGIAAVLSTDDLAMVQRQPGVEYIEQDGIVSIPDEQGVGGSSSGSERGESPYIPLPGEYGGNGNGVTIYGIDTGIYIEHECFGGRARWGKTFGNYTDADGNGHGTHTAGTAVGTKFGLATGAEIVAVKVLSDSGSGPYSDVIAGVNWAANDCRYGKQCILTMSLGGPSNSMLTEAVQAAIRRGLHFTVAAGNSNVDASDTSPANVGEVNTIGAVDATNKKAWFSNYGRLIDVWAPGVNIQSAWITGPDSSRNLSGTSMATPHVAGILAVALSEYGPMTPADLSQQLKDKALKEAVTFGTGEKEEQAKATSTHSLAQPW